MLLRLGIVVNVTTPELDMVRLLKVVLLPLIVCVVPLKFTVLEFAVNDPLFNQLPLTVRALLSVMARVAPELMVRLLQTAAAPITGWFPPDGITTFVEAFGIVPSHQFVAVFQSVLAEPFQLPAIQLEPETLTPPVDVAK